MTTATEIVTYRVDDETTVDIEIRPGADYVPASVGDVAGRVWNAAEPALKAAQAVLERARHFAPDDVQVKFGLKAVGKAHWLVAQASTEGNFEVTLTWRPRASG